MIRLRFAVLTCALAALLATPLAAQAPASALKTTDLGKGMTIVLVPGLGSQRMQWMPTARKLMAGHRVVMVDLPGHGESPMPNPFSFDAAAALLDGVLAKQNPDSTIVVAHGVGGLIAVMAAKAHPEHMKGLVVIDGALKSPMAIPDQQKKFFIEYIEANYDMFLRQMFKPLGRDTTQGVEIYSKAALVPSQNIKAYMRQLLDADASGAARASKVPLLYVSSSKAWPDTVQWSAIARQRGWDQVTQVKTRRIGNSGYLMMADQPDSLANVIAEFAKQVMGKGLASAD
ncbi:MAG: alpha/beta hydrolase [Candidatus Eisenbacteria bacterium]